MNEYVKMPMVEFLADIAGALESSTTSLVVVTDVGPEGPREYFIRQVTPRGPDLKPAPDSPA